MTTQKTETAHRLWGGAFGARSAPELDAINRSIGIDFRLWPHDIRLSKSWAAALGMAGVLTADESARLQEGLDRVAEKFAAGAAPIDSDEDIHTMVDRLLHDAAGDVASKLHTGRSRNDQVATATRLWVMHAATKIDAAVRGLQHALLTKASSVNGVIMPAYTHLQRAQPVAAGHWFLSHFWPLDRDRARIGVAARAASVLPLGSGAIAGCAYPISRVQLQKSLGFAGVSQNSIDAVGDRDFVADTIYAISMLAVHLSRMAEDLIIYGSSEFGFVRFGDTFTTGSSMMPQKRNPDALELARGTGARILGDLVALLATMKGLPSGYSKDMQDDKRALFDAVDTILLVLPAVRGTLAELSVVPEKMSAALASTMMATDLADYLVSKGVTFRDAHGAVGSLVREATERKCELNDLPQASFTQAHPEFDEGAYDALSAARSVERRDVTGGTGPNALRAQLEAAKRSLEG